MPKRGENIYKRKDGRWEGRYKLDFESNGQIKYKSVYGKSYKECKEKLVSVKREISKRSDNTNEFIYVKELFSEWLKINAFNIKDSTFNTYKNIVDKHILPIMSDMPVYLVTAKFLNLFINNKLKMGRLDGKGGLSVKTVQGIVGVLKSAFKYGEMNYGIYNPTNLIIVPKTTVSDIEVLNTNEITKIKEYCKNHYNYFSVVFDLCLATGIRIGELCALQCKDIDFENGVIKIRKTVQRIKNNDMCSDNKTIIVIDSPKTKNSNRDIPLPKEVLEKLNKYIGAKRGEDFIFSYDGKKTLDVRTIQKKFDTILRKCNIRKVNFHILRHTFATRWVNSRFDMKSLSEILGHSSVNITLALYVHSSVDVKRKQISELFEL